MSTFVLVHGAGSGGWNWYKVIPQLEQQGHTVIAPDLPGLGKDKTPLAEISLAAYVDRVCQVLDAQAEPVILVGHSLGGGVTTQVAEYRPDRIKLLVYVAGYLLENGQSMLDITQQDTETLLLANTIFSGDQLSATFRSEALKAIGYADCSDTDMALVRSLLAPQAVAPLATPVTTTAANFGRVPRVYLECLQDYVIGPLTQRKMYTALPCQSVLSMDTSHNPSLAAPETLVNHLLSLI